MVGLEDSYGLTGVNLDDFADGAIVKVQIVTSFIEFHGAHSAVVDVDAHQVSGSFIDLDGGPEVECHSERSVSELTG